jgi:hypothetical protein
MVAVQEEQVQHAPSGGLGLLWNFITSIILMFSVEAVSKFFFGAKKEEPVKHDADKPRHGVGVAPPKMKARFAEKSGLSRQFIPRNQVNYGLTKRIKP